MAAKSSIKRTLTDEDVFCFICRGILIEPVTVPCTHVFCKSCFEDSLQETSYSCPLCRKRISNWLRSAKKEDKLLNSDLWEQIKTQFKEEVSSKLKGLDDGLDERLQNQFRGKTILTPTGEVKEEFSKIYNAYEEQLRREREHEERASLELIERLQMTEEEERQREENISYNEMLRLQEIENKKPSVLPYCKISPKSSCSTSKKAVNLAKDKSSVATREDKKTVIGPMDYHIKRLSLSEGIPKKLALSSGIHRLTGRCPSSDSNDSISPELNHFKPIRVVPKTPPKRSYDGKIMEVTAKKITPLKLCTDISSSRDYTLSDPCRSIQSSFSAFKGKPDDIASTGEGMELIESVTDSGVLKEINLDENSDSNSVGVSKVDTDPKSFDDTIAMKIPKLSVSLIDTENLSALEELFDPEEQLRLEKRILQEKADHELALKLSREWERSYELRRTRVSKTGRTLPRQTTLVNSVVRRRKK